MKHRHDGLYNNSPLMPCRLHDIKIKHRDKDIQYAHDSEIINRIHYENYYENPEELIHNKKRWRKFQKQREV